MQSVYIHKHTDSLYSHGNKINIYINMVIISFKLQLKIIHSMVLIPTFQYTNDTTIHLKKHQISKVLYQSLGDSTDGLGRLTHCDLRQRNVPTCQICLKFSVSAVIPYFTGLRNYVAQIEFLSLFWRLVYAMNLYSLENKKDLSSLGCSGQSKPKRTWIRICVRMQQRKK